MMKRLNLFSTSETHKNRLTTNQPKYFDENNDFIKYDYLDCEMQLVDITDIPRNNRFYNGNTKKYGITINDKDYIVKFSKDNDMSVYCEYIASNIIQSIGISCHTVKLAILNGVIVNLIEDFTSGTPYSLHSYKDTRQTSEDTEIGTKEYAYDDVLYLIDKYLKISDIEMVRTKQAFWRMFICDAMIGNRDRHQGNWGYLKSNTNQGYFFAPLYDNGAGLFPGVNKVIQEYIDAETRYEFLYNRIYIFPASLFKIKRPDRLYRSNYYEMFEDLKIDKIFEDEVVKFRKNLSYQKLFEIAHNVCSYVPLPTEYRRFYIEIVTLRYMCIILRMEFKKSYQLLEEMLTKYE